MEEVLLKKNEIPNPNQWMMKNNCLMRLMILHFLLENLHHLWNLWTGSRMMMMMGMKMMMNRVQKSDKDKGRSSRDLHSPYCAFWGKLLKL